MDKSIKLGSLINIEYRARPSSFVAFAIIWAIAAALARFVFHHRARVAMAAGFSVAVGHFLCESWHQAGHARAAEESGFPMTGVLFDGPLAFSKYPENEGVVSAEVHVQRALGGPIFSAMLSLIALVGVVLVRPLGGLPLQLAIFLFLDNLLVFTIGALLPLGFTDGSTILRWRHFRHKKPGLSL